MGIGEGVWVIVQSAKCMTLQAMLTHLELLVPYNMLSRCSLILFRYIIHKNWVKLQKKNVSWRFSCLWKNWQTSLCKLNCTVNGLVKRSGTNLATHQWPSKSWMSPESQLGPDPPPPNNQRVVTWPDLPPLGVDPATFSTHLLHAIVIHFCPSMYSDSLLSFFT